MLVGKIAQRIYWTVTLALIAAASTASAADSTNLPRSSPESQGVSSAAVRTFVEAADKQVDSMHSFMLVRHGHVVAEGWWSPEAADKPHVLWSLSKSFTSTAVGLAVAEGKLSIDDKVLSFFPEDAPAEPSENLQAMRVRDLLTMSTGHAAEPWARGEEVWTKKFLAQPVPHQPGSTFLYNTPATYMQSAIVQKVTGQTLVDYLQPRLFDPLGIEKPTWDKSPQGISIGGYGLYLKTEDIAKFGQLYLQKGQWNGKQLVPADWIAQATSKQVDNDKAPSGGNPDWRQGYGFQFWQCRHGAYRGDGKDGQFCIVLPKQDAVIAITAHTGNMQRQLDLVWQHLLPAFHDEPLPENSAAADQLRAVLSNLTETEAARIARMEKIANHALVPHKVNTSPLPKYGYDRLDYGMTIGIERTPRGRLWACWVAGGDSPKAFFVLATSDDDGETWSDPRVVLDSHADGLGAERSILVGNLWTDPLGRLWLIFDQSMHMFDGRAGVWATMCENPDAAQPTWTEPKRIWHGVTLNKPTVLSTGEWMLPISLDQRTGFGPFKGCFRELDPLRGANVFASNDQGATWERRGAARFPNPDWHEHMIVERRDGTLWMLARTVKGIMETTSTDGGRTWSEPTASPIKHPNARFFIRRLKSGRLLLIKHGDRIDAHEGRVQLSAWLSEDDGQSWQGGLVLDERKGISYPDGFQAPDGLLYISYDRNRSTDGEILLARFTEEDVLAREFQGPRSKPKMLISRPLAP